MGIFEAKEAFVKHFEKEIGQALKSPGRSKLEEQTTQLHLVVPGYDFIIYGGDDDEENLHYFLNLFCDHVHGETNINTKNMIWFETCNYIVLLWEKQKED